MKLLIIEDDKGTYLFNSRDLCMLPHIPELMQCGLSSFKIEGRMKSVYYVASVVASYRKEIDSYIRDPINYIYDPKSLIELKKASHRKFTTGFYFGKSGNDSYQIDNSGYERNYDFVAMLIENQVEKNRILIEQRNYFEKGDLLEIMQPGEDYIEYRVDEMYDENMNLVTSAPHPQQKIYLPFSGVLKPFSLFRRKKEKF